MAKEKKLARAAVGVASASVVETSEGAECSSVRDEAASRKAVGGWRGCGGKKQEPWTLVVFKTSAGAGLGPVVAEPPSAHLNDFVASKTIPDSERPQHTGNSYAEASRILQAEMAENWMQGKSSQRSRSKERRHIKERPRVSRCRHRRS